MMYEMLKNIPLFHSLSDLIIESIVEKIKRKSYEQNEILFHQGDIGEELIIVKEGSISLFSPGGQPIRVVTSGDFFGEIALIDRKPRSLSARAKEFSVVYSLHGNDFRSLMIEYPELSDAVMNGLCERVRYTTDFLNEVRFWVNKISEGNYQNSSKYIDKVSYQSDHMINSLAEEFARMAAIVQAREDSLRNEVKKLRIEIDQAKRQKETGEIMNTEYYQMLQQKAKEFRELEE